MSRTVTTWTRTARRTTAAGLLIGVSASLAACSTRPARVDAPAATTRLDTPRPIQPGPGQPSGAGSSPGPASTPPATGAPTTGDPGPGPAD